MVDKTQVKVEPIEPVDIPVIGETTRPETESSESVDSETMIPRSELRRIVEEMQAERDERVAEAVANTRSLYVGTQVPAHSDGPGYGNPRQSWSLAQQEASLRGDPFE